MKNKKELLKKLYKEYENCISCPLGLAGRKNIVFGGGDPNSKLLLIGEAPGKHEDIKGKPFVGKAGQYLNSILKQAGIKTFYATNIVKCRPPANRKPSTIESTICKNLILNQQIKILQPKVICTLGLTALEEVTCKKWNLSLTRGSIIKKNNFKIVATYHPAYVARHRNKVEKNFIKDIKLILKLIFFDNISGG